MTAELEPRRRRGIYEIGDDELCRLLQLGAGQHVVSVNTSWERLSLLIMVEGPGLPECAPGNHPMVINRWGRFRPLTLVDVAKLAPGAAHAAVLAELGAVRFEDPAALAGRRRILERHAPHPTWKAWPACSNCVGEIGGDPDEWPCEDYLDAAAGLVAGLPGQDKRDEAIAAAAHAQLLEQMGDQVLEQGVMTRAEAVHALSFGDPEMGAKLDALVLGDQAEPTVHTEAGRAQLADAEARPGVETDRRRHRRTPPLDRTAQED